METGVGEGGGGSGPSSQVLRRKTLEYWSANLGTLKGMVEALRGTHVPAFLLLHMLKQLLSYIDIRVFNRWDMVPVEYSTGRGLDT